MYPDKPRVRAPKRSGVDKEEERAWVGFYRRVRSDAAVAAEVLAQLEADPESKRAHLALYLSCRESLRRHKHRQQRNRRIGQGLRRLLAGLAAWVFGPMQRAWSDSREIVIEALPEATGGHRRRPPSERRVQVGSEPAPHDLDGVPTRRWETDATRRVA